MTRLVRLALIPALLTLAACAGTVDFRDGSVTVTEKEGVRLGRDRFTRRGVERVGDVCLRRDDNDRGGRRISHAC